LAGDSPGAPEFVTLALDSRLGDLPPRFDDERWQISS
jgi:hypothetical protein